MRKLTALILGSILLFSCNSTSDLPTHINCDGLITDTLGTGDNARIYMPTAFTPNNDGLNDISRPWAFNVMSIVFTIYDEGNNVVYTSTQLNLGGWNPPVTATSTKYYYKIQAVTMGNRRIGLCGDLNKLSCLPSGVLLNSFHFEDQLTLTGFSGPTNETLPNCP